MSQQPQCVGPHVVRNPKAVAGQLHLSVKLQTATLLVVYSGAKAGIKIRGPARMCGRLGPAARVASVDGPAVPQRAERTENGERDCDLLLAERQYEGNGGDHRQVHE